jgi:ATP-dependent Lhr-like helicase
MRWLLRWQHVTPGTQQAGERGTLEVLQQLQGFEAPASAWEPYLLARRLARYDPKILDDLCLTGAVGWGRLSPHPATLSPEENEVTSAPGHAHGGEARRAGIMMAADRPKRRVVPTSVAPVTFFARDDSDWMTPLRSRVLDDDVRGLSPQGLESLEFLRRNGASFFADILRGTKRLKSEVETALWELVAAGRITGDGFSGLRALIWPKASAQGSWAP